MSNNRVSQNHLKQSNTKGMDNFPAEIITLIGTFLAHDNPKDIIPALSINKKFNLVLKPVLFQDIWCLVSDDDYFHRECSLDAIYKEVIWEDYVPRYNQRTLITSVDSLLLLLNVIEDESNGLFKLIKNFHINALNFNDGINKKIKASSVIRYNKRPLLRSIKPSNLNYLKAAVFETAINDFFKFDKHQTRSHLMKDYFRSKRDCPEQRNYNIVFNVPFEFQIFKVEEHRIDKVLFCPARRSSPVMKPCSTPRASNIKFSQILDQIDAIFSKSEVIKGLESWSVSILSLERVMEPSTLRTETYDQTGVRVLFNNFFAEK